VSAELGGRGAGPGGRAEPGGHGWQFGIAGTVVTDHPREPGRHASPDSHQYAAADLAAILAAVAAGQYPPPDGTVRILAQPSARDAGVISLTGWAVVFADTDADWMAAQLPPDDLSAPLSATFLTALSERLGRRSHSVDMLACAAALPGPPPPDLALTELPIGGRAPHPRIARALRYRDDVLAWQTTNGIVTLGRGLAGRWEVSVEVDPEDRGRGLGARLATAARHLIPADATLWAQIAPANAASVRAFLSAGFRPVGAEALLSRGERSLGATLPSAPPGQRGPSVKDSAGGGEPGA
jgi:GNAT superfamily N-acetyltransferase